MSAPLEDYFAMPPVTSTPLELPALEHRKIAALDKLSSMANRIKLMDSTDPRIQEIQRSAQLAVFYADTIQLSSFSPYEVCKYIETSTSKLEARITEYEKSKADYGRKSLEYSQASAQFQTKIGKANIDSTPLDSQGFGGKYAPWNGPGINETQLSFPSKEQIVRCVKQSPSAMQGNNPYLNDQKVVGHLASSIAGKTMIGLDFKEGALNELGNLRDRGELKIPPHPGNPGHLHDMYEVLAKCSLNEQKSDQPKDPSQGDIAKIFMDLPTFLDGLY